jgi:hypothetical protein
MHHNNTNLVGFNWREYEDWTCDPAPTKCHGLIDKSNAKDINPQFDESSGDRPHAVTIGVCLDHAKDSLAISTRSHT